MNGSGVSPFRPQEPKEKLLEGLGMLPGHPPVGANLGHLRELVRWIVFSSIFWYYHGMRIDLAKFRKIAGKRELSLNALLAKAGVSKTAFYHLVHKSSVLPASLGALAETLSVRPGAFLTEEDPDVAKIRRILALTDRIVAGDPKLDRDNVRLTLLLLEEEPVRRLRRSLIRGRKSNIHR
jgi:hypothetical protein